MRSYVDVALSLVELGVGADKAIEWLKGFKDYRLDGIDIDLSTPDLMDYDTPADDFNLESADTQAFNAEFKESDHPRDNDGKFTIDPNKDNILPNISKDVLEYLGIEDRPIRLKKSIIERNAGAHPDIDLKEAARIISSSLYSPEAVIPGNKENYYHFIGREEEGLSPLSLLDVEVSDDGYFDIVHYFKARSRSRKKMIEKKER